MKRTRRRYLDLIPIFLFVCVVVSINFFHTETTLDGSRDCPACHFLTSALATLAVLVVFLSIVLIAVFLVAVEPVRIDEAFVLDLSTRSPPAL
jgi:hypothetical protein